MAYLIFIKNLIFIVVLLLNFGGLSYSQDNFSNGLKVTFKDIRDGQDYNWIKIGSQVWMAENLRFQANIGCWTNHTINSDTVPCGRIYVWEPARTACPVSWHLPNDAEWSKLIKYLGESKIAGGKMKEEGTLHWQPPNTGATNESGFSAIPAVTNETHDIDLRENECLFLVILPGTLWNPLRRNHGEIVL